MVRPGHGRVHRRGRHAADPTARPGSAQRPPRAGVVGRRRVMIRIQVVREATPDRQSALARLLPQLNPNLEVPDMERLRRLIADPAVTLLLAVDGDDIVGTTTVIVYTTPFWIKARLDEVVVDDSARGKGVGEALIKAALDIGRERGAQVAGLQSGRGPARQAAHRLYLRLGFKIRDSDVLRIVL